MLDRNNGGSDSSSAVEDKAEWDDERRGGRIDSSEGVLAGRRQSGGDQKHSRGRWCRWLCSAEEGVGPADRRAIAGREGVWACGRR